MDLIEAIKVRKSVRAFKPDEVSKEQIEEILRLCHPCPSAINLQPWSLASLWVKRRRGSAEGSSSCIVINRSPAAPGT
jgi:hypothetical protein